MRNRCLVLGGNGFIGSHLVENLLEKGFKVSVFGRFDSKKVKNLKQVKNRITFYQGDLSNTQDLENALRNAEYVFHFICGSTPASTMHAPQEEVKLNLLPTINLLDLCVKYKVKKIIFPSSGGAIYGNISKGFAYEDDFTNPLSPHAINKLCIEKLLHYYFAHHNLDYLIYRISNVYGERQKTYGSQGIIPIAIKKGIKGEIIEVYGDTIRDYIYVKDVTSFIARTFNKIHKYKIYNVGGGEGISLSKLLITIRKFTGLTLHLRKLKKRKGDVKRIVLNIDRIKSEFAFKPEVNLKEGIKKTFDYINTRDL